MFFTELEKVLRSHVASVGMAMTLKGDLVTVVVTPTMAKEIADKAPHLNNPFVLTGSAADLDSGFASEFQQFAKAHATLADQVSAQINALQEETRAKAEAAKTKAASVKVAPRAGKAGVPASGELNKLLAGGDDADAEGGDEEGEGEDQDSGTASAAPSLVAKTPSSAPAVLTADELF